MAEDLPAEAFAKHDRDPDPLFYAQPRFVTHIDDAAIAGSLRVGGSAICRMRSPTPASPVTA
jgi:hypothetical protein